jgi:hypothetical protein
MSALFASRAAVLQAEAEQALVEKQIELEKLRQAPLIKAAQAVIDRWDTPLWKDAPATGRYINDLRKALAAVEKS